MFNLFRAKVITLLHVTICEALFLQYTHNVQISWKIRANYLQECTADAGLGFGRRGRIAHWIIYRSCLKNILISDRCNCVIWSNNVLIWLICSNATQLAQDIFCITPLGAFVMKNACTLRADRRHDAKKTNVVMKRAFVRRLTVNKHTQAYGRSVSVAVPTPQRVLQLVASCGRKLRVISTV